MITLFTGAPGAGKTAALVDLLSKLGTDRPLFVDGLEGLTLDHTPVDATAWPTELPDGAILVVDEAQRKWRGRGPGSAVPLAVQAMETHRHRGIDIYLTTQAPRLLDANVRGLVGRHVHIRDTGWLGRHWYEWPECNDSMTWKTCPNKHKYKLPQKAFGLYKSSSLHTTPIRKTPLALYVAIGTVVVAIGLGFMMVRTVTRGAEPVKEAKAPAEPGGGRTSPQRPDATGAAASSNGVRAIDDRVDWVPRISNRPESAPAFDHLRIVVNMPRIVGAIVMGKRAKCVTQQGTDSGLTDAECRAWVANPQFDPYTPPKGEGQAIPQPKQENVQGAGSGPVAMLLEGPGARDPLRAPANSNINPK